jgi:hypothetical protein
MEDTRIPKMIPKTKTKGRLGIGGPELRRLDGVQADKISLRIRRWRLKAQDRKNGRWF